MRTPRGSADGCRTGCGQGRADSNGAAAARRGCGRASEVGGEQRPGRVVAGGRGEVLGGGSAAYSERVGAAVEPVQQSGAAGDHQPGVVRDVDASADLGGVERQGRSARCRAGRDQRGSGRLAAVVRAGDARDRHVRERGRGGHRAAVEGPSLQRRDGRHPLLCEGFPSAHCRVPAGRQRHRPDPGLSRPGEAVGGAAGGGELGRRVPRAHSRQRGVEAGPASRERGDRACAGGHEGLSAGRGDGRQADADPAGADESGEQSGYATRWWRQWHAGRESRCRNPRHESGGHESERESEHPGGAGSFEPERSHRGRRPGRRLAVRGPAGYESAEQRAAEYSAAEHGPLGRPAGLVAVGSVGQAEFEHSEPRFARSRGSRPRFARRDAEPGVECAGCEDRPAHRPRRRGDARRHGCRRARGHAGYGRDGCGRGPPRRRGESEHKIPDYLVQDRTTELLGEQPRVLPPGGVIGG